MKPSRPRWLEGFMYRIISCSLPEKTVGAAEISLDGYCSIRKIESCQEKHRIP